LKRNFRRASQIIFLILFLVLLVKTDYTGSNEIPYPVKVFLDFDPLAFVATYLSAHTVPAVLFLSLTVILLTLLFGRVFCSFVCPLGTLNNAVSFFERKRVEGRGEKRKGQNVKYYLLLFVLGGALAGLEVAGIFDPISVMIRSLSLSVIPLFDWLVRSLLEPIYAAGIPVVSPGADVLLSVLEKTVLPFRSPVFRQTLLIGLIFGGILALNRLRTRFWCRYVCPLGALLGLVSRFQLLKLRMNEKCTACGECEEVCQGGAAPHLRDGWSPSECLSCFNCDAQCPFGALEWKFSLEKGTRDRMDLGRRWVLGSIAGGIAAVGLTRVSPAWARTDPYLIRPPGALKEEDFLARCIRCGECMKVCITGALQPTLFEGGLLAIWTPVLAPKMGYCEFNCTLCGQVCPTGAIKRLELEEKHKFKIGLAFIDKNRCLPYAQGVPCIVCEEHCPTPEKAIRFREIKAPNGKVVKAPVVDLDLCIGCAICEYKCPVRDIPAIRVTTAGETRNPEMRIPTSSAKY